MLNVTIRGYRESLTNVKTLVFEVIEKIDQFRPIAYTMHDMFIPWIEQIHPELGISNETVWTGTIVTPRRLVVSHYLSFSEEWEMHVAWHNTILPHN